MQNNHHLKPELVHGLNLEHHGYSHPEAVVIALESAQAEICNDTRTVPGQTFSVGSNMLQCLTVPQVDLGLVDNYQNISNSLFRYSESGIYPDRIVHFNFGSGDKMVEISTFRNCDIVSGTNSIPCFAIATL